MDRTTLDTALNALVQQLDSLRDLDASALLYGSAARGDWVPGRSDVNVLVLVSDASPAALRKLTPAVTAWHAAGFTPPLLMSKTEWDHAADVFPIEITDMQLAHRVLRGNDPVATVTVDRDDLRRALETELRGKLLRLRQAYVRFGESTPILGGFATASVSSVVVLLRCVSVLLGRAGDGSVAALVAGLPELGPGGASVVGLAGHRRDAEWGCPPERFVEYLDAVRAAVDLVDNFQRGDR